MKFIADRMLGSLARWLRIAGVDCAYERDLSSAGLLRLARAEQRVVLTRAVRLAASLRAGECLLIHSNGVAEQMREFADAFGRPDEAAAFSRCIVCNRALEEVPKEGLRFRVPPHVFETQERFKGCPSCGRIYWRATHFSRMAEKLGGMMRGEAE